MATMHKDFRKIEKALKKEGFRVDPTKGGHFAVIKEGARVATMAGSPSDPRAIKNLLADIKRATGFTLNPR